MSSTTLHHSPQGELSKGHKKVIFASSLGTVFEWYDFYLYGSLAAIIAKQFFSGVNETTGFIFALLAFAAGFAVRPFGAAFFGSLGDRIGRKYTFLVTIVLMGLSTFIVGILPSYASIGIAAPIILIVLRLAQGDEIESPRVELATELVVRDSTVAIGERIGPAPFATAEYR